MRITNETASKLRKGFVWTGITIVLTALVSSLFVSAMEYAVVTRPEFTSLTENVKLNTVDCEKIRKSRVNSSKRFMELEVKVAEIAGVGKATYLYISGQEYEHKMKN